MFAACLPLLAGCAKQDFASELDRTRSWTATTYLAADRRSARATGGAVTADLLDLASKARTRAEQRFPQLAQSDSERLAARAALDSLSEGIRHLQQVGP